MSTRENIRLIARAPLYDMFIIIYDTFSMNIDVITV